MVRVLISLLVGKSAKRLFCVQHCAGLEVSLYFLERASVMLLRPGYHLKERTVILANTFSGF